MPRLRVKDILDFRIDANKITTDELYPILQYLKIDFNTNFCTITKNGLRAFIKKNISSESNVSDGSMLVLEEKLFSFAEGVTSDYVDINYKEGSEGVLPVIKLSAGKSKGVSSTDDLNKFPVNDTPTADWVKLHTQFLTNLEYAKNFIQDFSDKAFSVPAPFHIFCKGNSLVACDGAIAFYKEFIEPIPQLILRKEVALAIYNMPGAEYSYNSSYDFFRSEGVFYAFSKSECPFFDLTQFGKIETNKLSFFLIKDDLLRYNSMCISSSKSKIIRCYFKAKTPTELELSFEDADSGIYSLITLLDIKDGEGSFKYDPNLMNNLLKSIPSTILYFYPGKGKYYITDEKQSFVTLMMGTI